MKLRHKKPLNPYKGQANNDKNEFNDDDFRQQGSPHKKNGNAPNDQIFKYARILAKFVKTINQDYRLTQGHSDQPDPRPSPELLFQAEKPDFDFEPPLDPPKNLQLKEKKQIPKLQLKIDTNEDPLHFKPIARKRDNPQTASLHPEPRSTPPPTGQNLSAKLQPNFSKPKVQPKGRETGKQGGEKEEGVKGGTANGQSPGAGVGVNNYMGMQGLQGVQGLPGMQGMMGQNPMLANMAMMMNGGNNMSQMQVAQLLMRYNNPSMFYGGYPMNMNMGMMGMGGMNNPYMFPPPRLNPNPKPIPNLFNEQFNAFKASRDSASPDIKTVYPLKRAAFHAAIAYKIYLDKLKRRGCTFECPQDIDPTKSARKVKSDQQTQAKSNTSKKKK